MNPPHPDATRMPPSHGLLGDLGRLRAYAVQVGMSPRTVVIPVILALGVGVFEAAGTALLIPLAKGMVGMDFSFLCEWRAFQAAKFVFPRLELRPATAFAGLVLLIFASFVAKNVMQYAASVAVAHAVRRLANGLRKLIFSRYMSFGKLFFDRSSAGHLHAVAIATVEKIAARLSDLHSLFTSAFTLLAYLAVMAYVSLELTAVLLVFFPLLGRSFRWVIPRVRRASSSFIERQAEMNKKLFNALSCIQVVKAYSMESAESERFARSSDDVESLERSMDRKILLIVPLQEVASLALVLFIVSVMGYIVSRQGTGRLPGFLVVFYVIRRAAASFSVISHIKTTLSAISGPLDEIDGVLSDDGKSKVPSGAKEFPGLRERIEFRELDFAYSPNTPILKKVTFSLERGKLTAVVGPTGSGKSTLASLLVRLYDCPPGTIFIDGIDVREYSLGSLRRHMAVVSQDTSLFNGTLRENIAYGLDPEPGAARISECVAKARLGDFVSGLPMGLETVIGDRGVQLSGGERQRVSIARALLKGSEILILDEATSALDSTTERLIQDAIDEMVGGKTAIVIAHRLSTVKRADKIVVLDGGRVVEEGALEPLLAARGEFHRHWEAQKFF